MNYQNKISKFLYLLLLVCLYACAQNASQKFSQEELVAVVLKDLKIDESKTDVIVSKVSPNNSKETIIVIPEIVNEKEDIYELNSYILIVDNTKGKISHQFFESSKENGWVSDAIFIEKIDIDTVDYKLNASKKAFGISIHFRNASQANPYNEKQISLFTKDKNSLKKVLDAYTLYESSGEVNVNACYGDYKKMVNVLSMGDSKTKDYYDILVNNTQIQENYREDDQGECNPIETLISAEKRVLKFDGEAYKQAQVTKLDVPEIMSVDKLQKSFIAKNKVAFLEQFPKNFEQFQSYFGWNATNDEPETLYHQANAYIDYWFELINTEAYSVYDAQIIEICVNGSWREDAVNYFQDKSIQYIKENQAYHLINNLSNEDAKSVLFFLFDSPHPKFDADFASHLNTSKQNILNEVFETMLFDHDDMDESDKQNDDIPFNDFSSYNNNDAYFIRAIDINKDAIQDKIICSKPYQGDELLLFINENDTYKLALKTINFSEDGGHQIKDIKKDESGFIIITAFPDRGFFEAHHYVAFKNKRWVLTHTIYKTASNNLDSEYVYVCNVKQGIDMSAPTLIDQLKAIPEESDRNSGCIKQKYQN